MSTNISAVAPTRRSASCPATASTASSPAPRSALMVIIASTTATSCTIRKPTAMRPCSESSSRLSDSSLTTMIVLEKVSATAT